MRGFRYLVKPAEPELFMETVNRLLDSKREQPERVERLEDSKQGTRFYKQYSAVLIAKLEEKVAQLELTNEKLESTIVELKKAEPIEATAPIAGINQPMPLLGTYGRLFET